MREPEKPPEERWRFKLDEGPDERDVERSWSPDPGDGISKWTSRLWQILIAIFAVVMVGTLVITLLPPCNRSGNAPDAEPAIELETGSVTRVIDGRTIVVNTGEGEVTVRYIGVETPGIDHPLRRLVAEVNTDWVIGKDVELERDSVDSDGQGRLLRYVYVEGVMVNAALIANGLATVATGSNVRYEYGLRQLEMQARNSGRGLWSLNDQGTPLPPTVQPDGST